MYVIRMLDGDEIHVSDATEVTIGPNNGVLTIQRTERHGDVLTHLSPMAWRSVTHRVKRGTGG